MYTDDINPKNYFGCALEVPSSDLRHPEWWSDRQEYGVDETEFWSLDITILDFMIQRLELAIMWKVYDPGTLVEIENILPVMHRLKFKIENHKTFKKDIKTFAAFMSSTFLICGTKSMQPSLDQKIYREISISGDLIWPYEHFPKSYGKNLYLIYNKTWQWNYIGYSGDFEIWRAATPQEIIDTLTIALKEELDYIDQNNNYIILGKSLKKLIQEKV